MITPSAGPWRLSERTTKTRGRLILTGYNREVASVYLHPDYMPMEREIDEANAKLIAAAPELRDALRFMLFGVRHEFPTGPDGQQQWRDAYAAQFAVLDAAGDRM